MIFTILAEAAKKGELLFVDGGMVHFSQKRNGTFTVHEIIVLPSHRRRGVGEALVQRIRDLHPGCKMRALCPIQYESNAFWKGIGCLHRGIKRSGDVRMNIWELPPEEELELVPPG